MPRSRRWISLARLTWIGVLVASSGANCYPSLVCQLPPEPTMTDVLAAVDGNANLVQSIYVIDAKITGRAQGQSIPMLKAHIALEKERRFRLLAEMPLIGREAADLGSNDEEFWFMLAQNDPPELFYIRHDDYARSAGRVPIPFDPYWVIEALGVSPLGEEVTFDGPVESFPGRLQLRSTRLSPQGEPVTKVVLVDSCTGYVREQFLYAASGERLASAVASNHQRDPSFGAVIPGRVQLEWPSQQLRLDIRLKDVSVNEDLSDSPDLWTKPTREGVLERNLFDAALPYLPQNGSPTPILQGTIEPVSPGSSDARRERRFQLPFFQR